MPMAYDRSCLRLDDFFLVVSRSLHLGIEKKEKHVNTANCFAHPPPPLLLASSLAGIKRAPLTAVSQTCMFATFATGVFPLSVV